MDRPFPAYDGDEPYVFVSYSHDNSSAVYAELIWLKENGFNIWYDEGIEAGTKWREEIAQAIKRADLFLYFVTPDSAQSENCNREVNFAVDEQIPIIAIHLTRTDLPDGLRLTMSDRQAVLKHEIPIEEYQQKLLSRVSSYLNQEITPTTRVINKRPALTIGAVIGIVLSIGVLASGLFFYIQEDAQQDAIMSIEYRDEPVRKLINEISDAADRNLIASDEIEGNITLTLKDVTWREALDSVAISRGYDVRVTENAIFISPRNLGELDTVLSDQPSTNTRDNVDLTQMRSIAVLPFANMSTSEATGFFADGLSEDVLDSLAQNESLQVASRSASFQFTERGVDPALIGMRLKVAYLLEGSVRQLGGKVRITAQLVRIADGFHVWSKSYERTLTDGFEMQTAIAANIANITQSKLNSDIYKNYGWKQEKWHAEISPIAVGHYIEAREELSNILLGEHGNYETFIQLLNKAVEVDSNYYQAYSLLANGYYQRHRLGRLSLQQARPAAHAAITKAIAIAPDNGYAQLQLTFIHSFLDLDYARGEIGFRQLLEQDPKIFWYHIQLARIALREGRTSEALRQIGNASPAGFDSFSQAFILASVSLILCVNRDYVGALQASARGLKFASGGEARAFVLRIHAANLVWLGKAEEAKQFIEEAWSLDRITSPESYIALFAYIGEIEKSKNILTDSHFDLVDHYHLGMGYLALGDIDNTFKSIKAGIEDHNELLLESVMVAEWWDPIRDDPRFDEMLELLDSKVTHTEQYLRDHNIAQEGQ